MPHKEIGVLTGESLMYFPDDKEWRAVRDLEIANARKPLGGYQSGGRVNVYSPSGATFARRKAV